LRRNSKKTRRGKTFWTAVYIDILKVQNDFARTQYFTTPYCSPCCFATRFSHYRNTTKFIFPLPFCDEILQAFSSLAVLQRNFAKDKKSPSRLDGGILYVSDRSGGLAGFSRISQNF